MALRLLLLIYGTEKPVVLEAAIMAQPDEEPGVSPSCHVLVVEDNRDGRETLRTLLELLGYRVDVAADGLEGVHKALIGHPEVVLIDIGLPLLNGYQVARQLRAALGPEVLLVAQTGYSQPEDRRLALEAGFDIHLSKPVDWAEVASWLALASRSPRCS